MKIKLIKLLVTLSLSLFSFYAYSQDESSSASSEDSDNEELNVIQVELEKNKSVVDSEQTSESDQKKIDDDKPIDFSGLGRLSSFSEVSVLQKRYMPKTGRFQLFGGGTFVTNDPFFNIFGLVGKAGYFFRESFGFELSYSFLNTSEAKSTQELRGIQGVETANLIYTKSAMYADFVWVPIYGKMNFSAQRIVPFDLYFSFGYGSTQTNVASSGTMHLATGQFFALSKSTAFRWDFSWDFFEAVGLDNKKGSYNNLFLTVGWSWFFPEATYR